MSNKRSVFVPFGNDPERLHDASQASAMSAARFALVFDLIARYSGEELVDKVRDVLTGNPAIDKMLLEFVLNSEQLRRAARRRK